MSSSESEDYEDSDFDLMRSDCEPSDNSDSDTSDDIRSSRGTKRFVGNLNCVIRAFVLRSSS